MANRSLVFIAALLLGVSAFAERHTGYVNMFLGTAGDHGQVSPAAQVPYGLVSVCPDCKVADRHAGYDYEVPEIYGVSVTRINGVGGNGTGGNLRIRPTLPEAPLSIIKGSEKAVPGYYEATLSNGVQVRCTASSNVAVEQFFFAPGSEKLLSIDLNSAIDPRRSRCSWEIKDNGHIEGWAESSTVCNFGAYRLYFSISFSSGWESMETEGDVVTLHFPVNNGRIEVRVALSPVSVEDASRQAELKRGSSFGRIRKAAEREWETLLSRVDVEGGSKEQRILLYTSLYRVFLTPMAACSTDGFYRGTDNQIHDARGRIYFSSWSMWDTYRTKFPLITLLDPEKMPDICWSLSQLYRNGKQNWATMNECCPTVRTEHSQLLMLDCWRKGIRGFDFAEAFPGMLDEYEHRISRSSPDQKMEAIYDIWALGGIAEILGRNDLAETFRGEADELFESTWTREFMHITDRFALMRGNGMYQGTRWQYRWALPVYAGRMAELAGAGSLSRQLEQFFSESLFNQGNEPDIHTPVMFNLFGHPELTDSVVTALLTDDGMVHRYGGNAEYPEAFVGRAFRNELRGYAPEMDEDDGAMSAWYVWCQMGIYPLCIGTDSYELFTPLFKRITLRSGGHRTVIERRCDEGKATGLAIDGKQWEGRSISHKKLIESKKIIWY